jgi:hypothetical protein
MDPAFLQQITVETEERALCYLSSLLVQMDPGMHPLYLQASGVTHDIIGAAIEVPEDKGPGLLESIYE